MPSSPTSPSRPTARPGDHKSRPSSSRRAVATSSATSSPALHWLSSSLPAGGNALANETRRLAQENSRLSRARVLKQHHLACRAHSSSSTTKTIPIPDGPGGWVDGEWEAFDDEEMARLEIEARRARREHEYRIRRTEEMASEEGAWIGPDAVVKDLRATADEEPEPPLDVLFDDYETRNESLMLDVDHDDEQHALPLVPDPQSNPFTAANTTASSTIGAAASIAAFDASLLDTPFCPACSATDRPLAGAPEGGLYCAAGAARDGAARAEGGCGLGIEMRLLVPLTEAFLAREGD